MGFNQELDLFCGTLVINWLIISGFVPLNYGADCKWTWRSSELEATYTTWDTSSRFLPCLVTAHTLLWLPRWRWRNLPLPGPLYHTYIILLEIQTSWNLFCRLNFMYNYIPLKVLIYMFYILIWFMYLVTLIYIYIYIYIYTYIYKTNVLQTGISICMKAQGIHNKSEKHLDFQHSQLLYRHNLWWSDIVSTGGATLLSWTGALTRQHDVLSNRWTCTVVFVFQPV